MIELKNIKKEFNIKYRKNETALSFVINTLKGKRKNKKICALHNISLRVNQGEKVGIIGLNGSGKSTILKIIGGIYKPNSGDILTKTNSIEYLSGFSQRAITKLTVRENILLTGSILGLSQKDIKKIFNNIIQEAELEDYVYSKFDHLSTGMRTRLSFSISINCLKHKRPGVILLDEIFSGGEDIKFREESEEKITELVKDKTMILVSHKMRDIEKYCDRVIWLEDGEVIAEGKPEEIIPKYKERYS